MSRLIHDYDFSSRTYFERNTLPSVTVPDQTLSIQQIFNRMSQGMSLDPFQRSGFYDDPKEFDEDYDGINPLEENPDLTSLPSPYSVDE